MRNVKDQKPNVKKNKKLQLKQAICKKNCERGSNCSPACVRKPWKNCYRNGSKIALEIGTGKIA